MKGEKLQTAAEIGGISCSYLSLLINGAGTAQRWRDLDPKLMLRALCRRRVYYESILERMYQMTAYFKTKLGDPTHVATDD
jgi:hypothetical protein